MFCRYLEIERCLRELMFSVQCLQRRSQQRHLSHTFLVKLKSCNSAHWHFPFQFPPSLRLLFQDISWLVTPLDFPELSQIENNSSSEFFTVCQQLYNCHHQCCWLRTLSVQILVNCNSLLVTLLTVFTGRSLQFSGITALFTGVTHRWSTACL